MHLFLGLKIKIRKLAMCCVLRDTCCIKMINLRLLTKSFQYAFRGFLKTFKEEQNLRIQTMFAVLVLFFGFYFRIDRIEWILLIFVVSLVMLMELANSAVERIADILKPRLNDYVKEIKDITAAAVLLAAITAVITGLIIFLPHIFSF